MRLPLCEAQKQYWPTDEEFFHLKFILVFQKKSKSGKKKGKGLQIMDVWTPEVKLL